MERGGRKPPFLVAVAGLCWSEPRCVRMASFHNLNFKSGLTVANLPNATTLAGMDAEFAVRVVTDATTPAAGSAPVGGGSAKALVWWNGTAGRVVGV